MFELKSELNEFKEFELKTNGLRVLIMEDHSVPVAAVMVSYLVGSYDEDKKHTGAAHMLEHMMFKGTDRYHRQKNTQIAALLERVGALMNANTGHDSTNYFEVLPSDRWKLALDIEASRMRHSLLDEKDFISEKSVIQNELERYFDYPTVLLSSAVWQEAFKETGYHHPVIGWREDVQQMPVAELKRLYKTFYQPNNAVLTIVGDVDTEEVLKTVGEKFSMITSADFPVRHEIKEPQQSGRRFVAVEKPTGVELIKMSFKMPGAADPDALALDLLGMTLSHGKTSRLYQRLVEKGLLANISCGGAGTRREGLFSFFATLTENVKHEQIEEIILEEIEKIRKDGISQGELKRSLSQIEAEMSYSRDGLYSLITELSHAIADGDWKFFSNYFENASKLTLCKIQEVACKYLDVSQMTVGYLHVKDKQSNSSAVANASDSFHQPQEIDLSANGHGIDEDIKKMLCDENDNIKQIENFKTKIEEKQIKGISLFSIKTGVKNIVSLSGSLACVGTAYGKNILIPNMTASMLDKGTLKKTKLEIAGTLENLGAHIDFHADSEFLNFHIRSLKKDLPQVFDLFTQQLKEPKFDESEFEKYKKRQRVNLQRAMASTGSVALNRFFQSLYGDKHLKRTIPFDQQLSILESASVDEMKAFYQSHYGKRDLLMAVGGDFDSALVNDFADYFENWKNPEVAKLSSTSIFENAPNAREDIHVPGVVNNDVFMGHAVSLLKTDAEYLSLYMANYILGADFTSRLSNIVRDQYGYTYGIRSALTGFSHVSTGLWVIHMIVNPAHLEAAIKKTEEVVANFFDKGVSEEELYHRKETIKGKFKVNLSTTGGVVDQILEISENRLGIEYLDDFPRIISNLTLDQVNTAIRRYFNLSKVHIVCAGQFS